MVETRIGGVYATFRADNNPFLRGSRQNITALRKQARATRELRRNAQQLRKTADAVGRSLLGFGKRVAQAATVALGFGVRSYANLQLTLASVRGITGASVEQFKLLSDQVRKLGRTTKFTAQQVAEGQLFLARAGFTVNEIYSALPGTLQLAQAAAVELGEAADIVSNVLAGFQAGADQTTHFGDVLARTTISANTNLLQLADGLKLVGPISKSLGVSLETTAASIGILSNAGLQATLAGTGLRRVLFNLEAPTASVTAILHDLELQISDVSISQNGLIEVLEKLRDSGISAAQAIQLFGARGAPAFNVLVAAIPQLRELEGVLENSAGTMAELARIQDDTLAGSFFRIVSAADGFATALIRVSGFGKSLRSTIDSMTESINKFTDYLINNSISLILDRARAAAELLFGVFLLTGPLGRAVISLGAMTRSVGYLTAAIGVATTAAKLLGRVLIVGLIVEGIIIAVESLGLLQRAVSETGASYFETFLTPVLDGYSELSNAILSVTNQLRVFLGIDPLPKIDLAKFFFGEEAAEAARLAGIRFVELFGEAAQIKLELLGLKTRVDFEFNPELDEGDGPKPPLPPPSSKSFASLLADDATRQTAKQITFLEGTLNLEQKILREIEDSTRQRERSLELVGLMGEALAVAEARQEVISRFEDERLRITRELVESTEKSGRAVIAEQSARKASNVELERSAKRVRLSAEARQRILRLDLMILDEQVKRVDLLANSAANEARAQSVADKAAANFEYFRGVVENAGDAVANFATTSISGFDNVGDAVKRLGLSIVNDLLRILVRKSITQFLGLFLGGGGGGGAAGGSFIDLGFASAQHGGLRSGFTLVGEAGPELIDFRKPGRVYTNEQLQSAVSGGAPVFNFNPIIQSSDGPAVRRAVLESFPIFEERVLRQFTGDMRRPSALRTAIR